MRWLTEILCRRLVAENADLRARSEYYAGKAEQAEDLAETRGRNEQRMSRDIDDYERRLKQQAATIFDLREQLAAKPKPAPEAGRLERALRGCARYRRQLAALQWEFDDAFGLHHPAVIAGAKWQERRQDKPQGGLAPAESTGV